MTTTSDMETREALAAIAKAWWGDRAFRVWLDLLWERRQARAQHDFLCGQVSQLKQPPPVQMPFGKPICKTELDEMAANQRERLPVVQSDLAALADRLRTMEAEIKTARSKAGTALRQRIRRAGIDPRSELARRSWSNHMYQDL
jgi:hypothetical protein